MPISPRGILPLSLCLCLIFGGCKPKPDDQNPSGGEPPQAGADPVHKEVAEYGSSLRQIFEQRQFDELDRRADEVRASKARFGNGGWKIVAFYNALDCTPDEPESHWQLHQQITEAWVAAKPGSITARVALLQFLTSYAWHARGNGYANTVSSEGGRLFDERLKAAHQVLIDSSGLPAKCPVWWFVGQRIALGEGWPRANYDKFVARAEAMEPTFWGYEVARSRYLSIKWYGKPGEWEQAAETAAADPKGLGLEIYARCAVEQVGNYIKFFDETKAKWDKVKAGYEMLERQYPDSHEVASGFCRLACVAGDRPTAKRLFAKLNEDDFTDMWVSREYYWHTARTWANAMP